MSLLIGITGNMYAGKNTLADMLVAARPELGLQVSGWADLLKEAALALDPWIPDRGTRDFGGFQSEPVIRLSNLIAHNGWSEAKKNHWVRDFLQKLGTEAGRDVHGIDCWVDAWFRAHPEWRYENHIIADTRFDNEAQAIRRRGGIVIRITRPDTDGNAGTHASEAGVRPELVDLTLHNSGSLGALRGWAEQIAAGLKA